MSMKSNIKQISKKVFQATFATYAASIAYSSSAFANAKDSLIEGSGATGQAGGVTFQSGIGTITNILLFLIGTIAVIAIVIGGIRYTTSNGDASQTKAAKDTILYAVIGLIVAIMAYAIVRWVVDAFMK